MNRFFASIVLLILVASQGIAQSRSSLKGMVTDSLTKEALEFSTVAVLDLKDSSLVSYTLTVKGGGFLLHNLPAGKEMKLVVSFVGYQNFRKVLTLEKGSTLDAGAIKLSRKGNLLSEVKLTAELTPVIIKKDTIEFSAEAFKTPPNAVVEQLLKRLPGVQVNLDGSITVNGKKVNKLLIDGKQFFVNDPKIASRNLDASLIDKVQVYDDRDNDPDHLIPDSRVDKIINLKFKKSIKKSTFGKIRGGGGTRDRFDGGLLYNMFRDTLQVSLIGIGNNLNRTGFSNGNLNDLGGFNRSGSDALDNGSVATGGKGYGDIQTVGSGGVNLNNNYGKSLKLNLLYYYSYTSDVYRSAAFTQQFFSDTTLSTNSTSTTHNTDSRHTISGLVEWEPDTLFKVRYVPRISYTGNGSNFTNDNNSFNSYVPRLNESTNSGNSERNAMQFQQSLSYYRKLHKKGSSLNITHDLNISPGTGLAYSANNFTSYSALLPSSNLVRLADNATGNTDASLDITYRYRFNKKLIEDVSLNANYNYNLGRLITYNQDLQTGRYDIYIDSLSRNLQRYQFTQTLRPEFNYQINKETVLSVNLDVQMMQTDNHFNRSFPDIDRRGVYLLPALRFYNAKLSFNYSSSVRQPSINDLLPQTTFYSQLYSSVGNPDLKSTRSHNFNLNYYTYESEKLLNTSVYSGLNLDENSVFSQRTVSSEGGI
ncbi:MAG: TonB-dependent receptor [Sphingobacteriaceae bacterium]|nr:MAG: TonB-dependent receptor [Sphingobacteriaceae bacterium]